MTLTSHDEEESLEERLKAWRKEQYNVASQVIIKEDSCLSLVDHRRFQCISLERQQEDNSSFLFGGVDVSFPSSESDPAVAVYVVIDSRANKVVYHNSEYFHLTLPYVSSYLSFREIEPLVRLVGKQVSTLPAHTPQIILVDGNGILHERLAGIACFLGVYTNIPTIGVAKSLYCCQGLTKELVNQGVNASLQAALTELEENTKWRDEIMNASKRILLMDKQSLSVNSLSTLQQEEVTMDRKGSVDRLSRYGCQGLSVKLQGSDGRVLAAALVGHGSGVSGNRHQQGTTVPIFISVGHNVSLEHAVDICASLSIARIPEPVRQADLSGRALLRQNEKNKR